MRVPRLLCAAVLLLALLAGLAAAQSGFYLKPGDRVVFYGDSITDQRLYTTFVETFVRTRFPSLDVSFVHSGWGGRPCHWRRRRTHRPSPAPRRRALPP